MTEGLLLAPAALKLQARYSTLAIALHWTIAAALLFELGVGSRIDDGVGGSSFSTLDLHKSVGLTILALALLRLTWRIGHRPPPLPHTLARWERTMAGLTHCLWYVLLLGLPLSGWVLATSNSQNAPLRLYGVINWPAFPGMVALGGMREYVSDSAERVHRVFIYLAYALLLLHVAGALKHHIVDGGGLLARMIPGLHRLVDWRLLLVAGVALGCFLIGGGYGAASMPATLRAALGLGVVKIRWLDPSKTKIFTGIVQPILSDKCYQCHGPDKQKGSLRLDSFADLMKGGENGLVVKAGNPEDSELLQRIVLPSSQKEAMPPRGHAPVNAGEEELLRWWINTGASADMFIVAGNPPPIVQKILDGLGVISDDPFIRPIAQADPVAIERAEQAGFSVLPLYRDGGYLDVQIALTGGIAVPRALDSLTMLAPQLVWLDLSGVQLREGSFAVIARLESLFKLSLAHTNVSDENLTSITRLPHLTALNLYGTAITDAGLVAIASIPTLATLYLTETRVTAPGIAKLKARRPSLKIIWSESPDNRAALPNPEHPKKSTM